MTLTIKLTREAAEALIKVAGPHTTEDREGIALFEAVRALRAALDKGER